MGKKENLSEEHKFREMEQNKMLFAELERYLKSSKKRRRSRLEIYHDILWLIQTQNHKIRPTNIQLSIKTSYDKFTKYLKELERSELIQKQPFSITEKGRQFLVDYDKLMKYIPTEK